MRHFVLFGSWLVMSAGCASKTVRPPEKPETGWISDSEFRLKKEESCSEEGPEAIKEYVRACLRADKSARQEFHDLFMAPLIVAGRCGSAYAEPGCKQPVQEEFDREVFQRGKTEFLHRLVKNSATACESTLIFRLEGMRGKVRHIYDDFNRDNKTDYRMP